MGKRELVLIAVFIVLGTGLYHLTAPPNPDGRGFSLRGMVDQIRREVGPRKEYLGDQRTETIAIGPEISEVRLARAHRVEIRGTDTPNARLQIKVYSTGLDETEARTFAKRVELRQQRSGDVLALEFTYPEEATQRTMVSLELPSRVRVRITRSRGGVEVKGVAALELDQTGGEVTVAGIDGMVRGSHSGGAIIVEKAKEIELSVRRCEVTLTDVVGDVRLDAASGGSLSARGVGGNLTIEGNRLAVELEGVAGTISADLTQGHFEASGISSRLRVDARGTAIRMELARPVPATAYTTDETIDVRLPAEGGLTLDVNVEDGDIRLPSGAPEVTTLDDTRRARGDLRGGGPALQLRTSHADIVVR